MATTVQVSRKTKRLLDMMERRMSAKSHDEVLRKLVAEKMWMPVLLLGSSSRLTPFSKEEGAESHEL